MPAPIYPTGLTGTAAILRVRDKTNEYNKPVDAVVLRFLNAGIEQVESKLNGVYFNKPIPVNPGDNTVILPADLQDIIDLNYSIVLPTAANAAIYPIELLDEGRFMEFCGFQPGLSGGQPAVAFVQTDIYNAITLQFFPSIATAGFINVYYKQRAQMWDPAATNQGITNLDSAFQDLAVLFACKEVCENRQRMSAAKVYFDQFGTLLEEQKTEIRKRTRPKVAQVRDVNVLQLGIPYWARDSF